MRFIFSHLLSGLCSALAPFSSQWPCQSLRQGAGLAKPLKSQESFQVGQFKEALDEVKTVVILLHPCSKIDSARRF
jgi:hypothetical protein